MPDYIPPSDDAFDTFQNQYKAYVNANLAALGLSALDSDVVAMNTSGGDWLAKYPAHVAAQAAAIGAREAKDASRAAYEVVLRRLTGRLQSSAAVDDFERAALGITIRDDQPTPVGAPTTRPVIIADTSQRLQITVNFADEGTPTSRAKPAGVIGCEIHMKVDGAPPTDLSQCEFVAFDTRTPYVMEFDGTDANKTVHIIGLWVSTRGEKGPLSTTVSATVPA